MSTSAELIQAIDLTSSSKVFILLVILTVIFFIVWILIKPDKSRKIGILPFPSSGPFVPLDSSDCGRNVVTCTGDGQTCNSICSSENYKCTPINGKEVWYLGTKLDPKKNYCLPDQDIGGNPLQTCGTYTGKAVWNKGPPSHWDCQCKYPSLFNGPDCMTQVACSSELGPPIIKPSSTYGQLVKTDGSGSVWDPTKMSATSEADNPLDWNGDKSKYACNCDDKVGGYTKKGDPYRCHSNLCYAGTPPIPSSKAASNDYFDPITNQCVCDNVQTVKSNVTGFCYPIQGEDTPFQNNCQPDILTGNCSCGNKFIQSKKDPNDHSSLGVFFRRGTDIYITTYKIPGDPSCYGTDNCHIYRVKINNFADSNVLNTLNTTLNDITGSIIEFTLMQYRLKDDIDINSTPFTQYINNSMGPFTTYANATAYMNNIVQQANNPGLVTVPCDSYFYNRPYDIGCPSTGCVKCSDPYYANSGSDQNNKNGTMCFAPTMNQLCGDHGKPTIDIFDPEGYACVCAGDDCIYKVAKNEETLNGTHHVHTCKKCLKCKGEECGSDSECGPCHKCNKYVSGAHIGHKCGADGGCTIM